MSEASLGSTVQPQTLEEYDAERRASATSPSDENSRGTNVHVASTDENSERDYQQVWNFWVTEEYSEQDYEQVLNLSMSEYPNRLIEYMQ